MVFNIQTINSDENLCENLSWVFTINVIYSTRFMGKICWECHMSSRVKFNSFILFLQSFYNKKKKWFATSIFKIKMRSQVRISPGCTKNLNFLFHEILYVSWKLSIKLSWESRVFSRKYLIFFMFCHETFVWKINGI